MRLLRSLIFFPILFLIVLGGYTTSLVFAENSEDNTAAAEKCQKTFQESKTVFLPQLSDDYRHQIVADWEKQELEKNRSLYSEDAILDLADRTRNLCDYLEESDGITSELSDRINAELEGITADTVSRMDIEQRLSRYLVLRGLAREAAFSNPLVQGKKIVFLKRNRFVCQMMHEYLGYYYQYGGISGGSLCLLPNPGFSDEIKDLSAGKFPRGTFETLALSFDAKTLYFAFADLSKVQDENAPYRTSRDLGQLDFHKHFAEYQKQEDGKFHLFKMDVDNGTPQQLTFGPFDDFDPLPLPNGSLAFISTRRGGFVRCNSHWEPLQSYTLHELLDDGGIRRLSWHETDEWHPSLTRDGRILYTRWDYVDRNAARHHGLWITNPDGTAASTLFGNYTYEVNACYQPKAIPDSNKIIFVAGAHHLVVGGSLVILDPTKVKYDEQSAEDTFDALEVITPEVPFAETPDDLPETYYYSPYPLSEDVYFVSYSHDALGGMLSGTSPTETGRLGLYYRDRFGNLELFYEDQDFSCMYPIPWEPRTVPAVVPSALPESSLKAQFEFGTINKTAEEFPNQDDAATYQKDKKQQGTFVLSNVNESLIPFSPGRKIKELRVYQLLPKYPDFQGGVPAIAHSVHENVRAYLGSIPVEADGSAHFNVPANKPLYFQAVDEDGLAVQTMRSEVYLQEGENRGCVGCHEQALTVQQNFLQQSIALGRPASDLKCDIDDVAPFSYPRLIQPILDRACVACHNSSKTEDTDNVEPVLSGEIQDHFTASYINLKPYLRWYEWGGNSIQQVATLPERCGATESPLTKILSDETHRDIPNFTERDRQIISFWLDSNIPFYGVYDPGEQERQQRGEKVELPLLQ